MTSLLRSRSRAGPPGKPGRQVERPLDGLHGRRSLGALEGRAASVLGPWLRQWSPALRSGVTAVAVWVLTIAPVVTYRAVWPAKVFAVVALLAGVTAPVLVGRFPRMARHLGITVFFAGGVLAWTTAVWVAAVPPHGAARFWLGAVAWALHGISWADARPSARAAGRGGGDSGERLRAHGLEPRRPLPTSVVVCGVASVTLAVAVVAAGWHVVRVERSVLAHTLATAVALGLVATGASLAMLCARLPEHARAPSLLAGLGAIRARGWLLLFGLVLIVVALHLHWP